MIRPYSVALVQSVIRQVSDVARRDEIVRENLYRNLAMSDYAAHRFGGAKLVVWPEFCLTGAGHSRTVEWWEQVALRVPGPETEIIGNFCRERGIYLCASTMEFDPDWPGRWWICAFIVGPTGEVILRYRKLYPGSTNGLLNATDPGDVYTEYVRRYGEDALFPVVDTPIGKLACLVCYDINFPEVARALTLRGAEVLLYPTGEPYATHRPAWENARRTRAYENLCYLLSVNHGAYISQVDGQFSDSGFGLFQERREGEIAPEWRSHGGSEAVSYDGTVLARVDGPGEAVVTATLNLEALRYRRSQVMLNIPAQLRPELYAPIYAGVAAGPLDSWLDEPVRQSRQSADLTRASIRGLVEQGVYAESAFAERLAAAEAPRTNGEAR